MEPKTTIGSDLTAPICCPETQRGIGVSDSRAHRGRPSRNSVSKSTQFLSRLRLSRQQERSAEPSASGLASAPTSGAFAGAGLLPRECDAAVHAKGRREIPALVAARRVQLVDLPRVGAEVDRTLVGAEGRGACAHDYR